MYGFLVFGSEYFGPKWTKFQEERKSDYVKMTYCGEAGGKQIKSGKSYAKKCIETLGNYHVVET